MDDSAELQYRSTLFRPHPSAMSRNNSWFCYHIRQSIWDWRGCVFVFSVGCRWGANSFPSCYCCTGDMPPGSEPSSHGAREQRSNIESEMHTANQGTAFQFHLHLPSTLGSQSYAWAVGAQIVWATWEGDNLVGNFTFCGSFFTGLWIGKSHGVGT